MRNELKVCTYKQAKRLKELGVQQIGLFCWIPKLTDKDTINEAEADLHDDSDAAGNIQGWLYMNFRFQAFDSAELGVMLNVFRLQTSANNTYGQHGYCTIWNRNTLDESICSIITDKGGIPLVTVKHENEAAARASLLIRLIEENVITVNAINEHYLKFC